MTLLKSFNTLLSFLLELVMLFAYGYYGFQTASGALLKWALAIGLPLFAAVIWGMFFAPNAVRRFSALPGVFLSLVLFLLGAWGLWNTGQPMAAMLFAVVAVVNRAFVWLWRQWG